MHLPSILVGFAIAAYLYSIVVWTEPESNDAQRASKSEVMGIALLFFLLLLTVWLCCYCLSCCYRQATRRWRSDRSISDKPVPPELTNLSAKPEHNVPVVLPYIVAENCRTLEHRLPKCCLDQQQLNQRLDETECEALAAMITRGKERIYAMNKKYSALVLRYPILKQLDRLQNMDSNGTATWIQQFKALLPTGVADKVFTKGDVARMKSQFGAGRDKYRQEKAGLRGKIFVLSLLLQKKEKERQVLIDDLDGCRNHQKLATKSSLTSTHHIWEQAPDPIHSNVDTGVQVSNPKQSAEQCEELNDIGSEIEKHAKLRDSLRDEVEKLKADKEAFEIEAILAQDQKVYKLRRQALADKVKDLEREELLFGAEQQTRPINEGAYAFRIKKLEKELTDCKAQLSKNTSELIEKLTKASADSQDCERKLAEYELEKKIADTLIEMQHEELKRRSTITESTIAELKKREEEMDELRNQRDLAQNLAAYRVRRVQWDDDRFAPQREISLTLLQNDVKWLWQELRELVETHAKRHSFGVANDLAIPPLLSILKQVLNLDRNASDKFKGNREERQQGIRGRTRSVRFQEQATHADNPGPGGDTGEVPADSRVGGNGPNSNADMDDVPMSENRGGGGGNRSGGGGNKGGGGGGGGNRGGGGGGGGGGHGARG